MSYNTSGFYIHHIGLKIYEWKIQNEKFVKWEPIIIIRNGLNMLENAIARFYCVSGFKPKSEYKIQDVIVCNKNSRLVLV